MPALARRFALAALAAGGASPAAVGVDAFFVVELFSPFGLEDAQTGALVARSSVELALDRNEVEVTASVEGPGTGRAVGTATGTVTNLLDEALVGVWGLNFFDDVTARFDAPNEFATGAFEATLLLEGAFENGVEDVLVVGPEDGFCEAFPCTFSFGDGSISDTVFAIGPGETLPVELSVEAVAIAAVPAPAALGPAGLALAGLAWMGRRRPRRRAPRA